MCKLWNYEVVPKELYHNSTKNVRKANASNVEHGNGIVQVAQLTQWHTIGHMARLKMLQVVFISVTIVHKNPQKYADSTNFTE